MVENRWRDSQAWCVMRWSRMHEEMANNVQWDTLSFFSCAISEIYPYNIRYIERYFSQSEIGIAAWHLIISRHIFSTISSHILDHLVTHSQPYIYTSQLLSIMQNFLCIYCICNWYEWMQLTNREFSRILMRNEKWLFSILARILENENSHWKP